MRPTNTNTQETFGTYLRTLLKNHGRTAKTLAGWLNFRPPYISDVLAGNNKPFKLDVLEKIKEKIPLSSKEAEHLYDLAGKERNEIAPDLMALVRDTKQVYNLLRIIKRNNISEKQLQQICKTLSSKGRE